MKYALPISVIMPFYNAGQYIGLAIQSILGQSFTNFELIIINDGSTDNTLAEVEKFTDNRIKIINSPKNQGNYTARNMGIKAAKGKYIAMMDADDISLTNRLEVQYNYLQKNETVGCVGALSQIIGENNQIIGSISRPIDYPCLKVNLLKDNQVTQSTIMVRHSLLIKYNLFYDENLQCTADYKFVIQASRLFRVENIHTVLLQYRTHNNQISDKNRTEQLRIADELRIEQIRQFELAITKQDEILHLKLMKLQVLTRAELALAVKWFNKLIEANENRKIYNPKLLFYFFKSIIQYAIKNAI